ncbi:MarR family transcriptional regulator [Priestia endophytica]|uniref:MarR family transcriptional regulator n=1 Tax=Priestia endophytica TaxID=135735 RepID=A0AAX1QDI1_9BACI|nr:MarR family transcriptional regulator [Priestia endophytica]RAS88243.1 MarR family transcriptional regulator [Priestia endophytica]
MKWKKNLVLYNPLFYPSLRKWKLSTAQFDILVQVGSHERLSQQELANKLFVTKGNITQLLSKMEELGLIKREQEWKTKYLSLTEEGKEFFYEVVPKQEYFQASQFSNLNYKEKNSF